MADRPATWRQIFIVGALVGASVVWGFGVCWWLGSHVAPRAAVEALQLRVLELEKRGAPK